MYLLLQEGNKLLHITFTLCQNYVTCFTFRRNCDINCDSLHFRDEKSESERL